MAGRKKANQTATPTDTMTFDDAMAELEKVIETIETGEIGLEKSLEEYERGTVLFKRCRSILNETEQKFEKIKLDLDDDNNA